MLLCDVTEDDVVDQNDGLDTIKKSVDTIQKSTVSNKIDTIQKSTDFFVTNLHDDEADAQSESSEISKTSNEISQISQMSQISEKSKSTDTIFYDCKSYLQSDL